MNFIIIYRFLPERVKVEKAKKLVANLHDKTEHVIHILYLPFPSREFVCQSSQLQVFATLANFWLTESRCGCLHPVTFFSCNFTFVARGSPLLLLYWFVVCRVYFLIDVSSGLLGQCSTTRSCFGKSIFDKSFLWVILRTCWLVTLSILLI